MLHALLGFGQEREAIWKTKLYPFVQSLLSAGAVDFAFLHPENKNDSALTELVFVGQNDYLEFFIYPEISNHFQQDLLTARLQKTFPRSFDDPGFPGSNFTWNLPQGESFYSIDQWKLIFQVGSFGLNWHLKKMMSQGILWTKKEKLQYVATLQLELLNRLEWSPSRIGGLMAYIYEEAFSRSANGMDQLRTIRNTYINDRQPIYYFILKYWDSTQGNQTLDTLFVESFHAWIDPYFAVLSRRESLAYINDELDKYRQIHNIFKMIQVQFGLSVGEGNMLNYLLWQGVQEVVGKKYSKQINLKKE